MPTNTTTVLTALRAHLIAAGLVRKGSVAGALPPLVLDPVAGPPAPGELEGIFGDPDLVITARPGGDFPPAPPDGWLLKATIDLIYRGHASDQIATVDAAILAEMYLPGGMAKTAWLMGGLQMIETRSWAGLQRLAGTRGEGFTYVSKLYVETYR